jgi:hypothetical protein
MDLTNPIDLEKWEKGYENRELLYVNYQYHRDVCKKSLERYHQIEDLQSQVEKLKEWIRIAIPEVLPLSHKNKGKQLLKGE